jgi:hypothetical protein
VLELLGLVLLPQILPGTPAVHPQPTCMQGHRQSFNP